MQQEDRLKWAELISKDRDAFFEKYSWFLGFFSTVAIVVVISIILYILIFKFQNIDGPRFIRHGF